MGTEDWILNGTKLMINTEKQKLKMQSRGQTLKNTILKKQNHKNCIKKIDEICFKNRVFFSCKVIVGCKNEN